MKPEYVPSDYRTVSPYLVVNGARVAGGTTLWIATRVDR